MLYEAALVELSIGGAERTPLTVECDSQPLVLFTNIFESFLQRHKLSFDLSNLGFELARVDCDFSATGAGKLLVRLYPSDRFLSFAGAIFAGK